MYQLQSLSNIENLGERNLEWYENPWWFKGYKMSSYNFKSQVELIQQISKLFWTGRQCMTLVYIYN
jgi:hypothetical protein